MSIFRHVIVCLFLLATPLPQLQAQAPPVMQHRYVQSTGEESTIFTWTMEQGEPVYLRTADSNETTSLLCTSEGDVLEWRFTNSSGTAITAIRSGNSIRVTGTVEGEPTEKKLQLDERPWFQFLSFSLRPFLANSDAERTSFWILAPSRLEAHLMEAVKEGSDPIVLHDQPIAAIKVRVAPDGMLGKLFFGHYWYRLPDFLWLKYQGDHGPLTPETTIHLVQENIH